MKVKNSRGKKIKWSNHQNRKINKREQKEKSKAITKRLAALPTLQKVKEMCIRKPTTKTQYVNFRAVERADPTFAHYRIQQPNPVLPYISKGHSKC